MAVKDKVTFCPICGNVTDHVPCGICRSNRRDASLICVVEEASDVMALESTGDFGGVFHVLGGVISPLDGTGPEDLTIRELVARVSGAIRVPDEIAQKAHGFEVDGDTQTPPAISEVILAVNPNVEGDTTAHYLTMLLRPFEVKVTRIAHGLPVGGDLEYADPATLARAMAARVSV